MLWANLGVKSSLTKMRDVSSREMPDGKGGLKKYNTQAIYRLLITSRNACAIAERTVKLGKARANFEFCEAVESPGYSIPMTATFVRLENLPNEDAYCLTVDSEDHAWTVNGFITHNTEITLNNSDQEIFVCNLGSINLSRVDPMIDSARFEHVVKMGMRMLDNVIDINYYPSDRAMLSNKRHRPVGFGVMGYMEFLVKHGVDFESYEHLEVSDKLFELLSANVISASIDLAKVRGAYPTFSGSKWHHGILPIDTAKESLKGELHYPEIWKRIREDLKRFGIRNSNCMAIAPTATISNIAGTTPCIEAAVDLIYSKTNLSGDFLVVDPTLKYEKPKLTKGMFDIAPIWVIRAAAVRQKWIDQAQSTNIFIKKGVKGKDLAALYELAWELGLKTTYYLRSQSQTVVESTDTAPVDEPVKMCSILDSGCEACQ